MIGIRWTWVAIIILIIIILIWIMATLGKTGYLPEGVFRDTYDSMIVSAHRQYDKYFEDPCNIYLNTIGYQNDDVAKLALKRCKQRNSTHNINEKAGRLSRKGANDAAVNSFIIGDILRYNVLPNLPEVERTATLAEATAYYGQALQRINNYPRSIATETKQNQPSVDTMLYRIQEFYDDINQPLPYQIDNIRNDIRNIRAQQHTLKKSKKPKKLKKSKINPQKELYYKIDIHSSPQNVHDTNVSYDLKNKYQLIVDSNAADSTQVQNSINLNTIRSFIQKSNIDNDKKKDALSIVDLASRSGHINNLDTTEDQVLLETWKRTESPENVNVKDTLQNAVVDALVHCYETNYGDAKSVCINGRCGRIIDSLTVLDNNKDISQPIKTVDILKSEIFMKSYNILQKELEKVPKEVADVYNGVAQPTPELQKRVSDFENSTAELLEKTIRNDYPDTKASVLDNIIADAKAGI